MTARSEIDGTPVIVCRSDARLAGGARQRHAHRRGRRRGRRMSTATVRASGRAARISIVPGRAAGGGVHGPVPTGAMRGAKAVELGETRRRVTETHGNIAP
ncbi:hypothetical protein Pen01_66790 [Phytomonospora endophytica]|nr:hypothetical protein Pen01_66790 [Phytomonospora endophytica]